MIQRFGSRLVRSAWYAVPGILLIVAQACAGRLPPRQPAQGPPPSSAAAPGSRRLPFTATAYCSGAKTAAGTRVTPGMVAADPELLPIGSVIRLAGLERRYNGLYTVTDTGSKIQGRRIDLYIVDCTEAIKFGRRSADVSVLRRSSISRARPRE